MITLVSAVTTMSNLFVIMEIARTPPVDHFITPGQFSHFTYASLFFFP